LKQSLISVGFVLISFSSVGLLPLSVSCFQVISPHTYQQQHSNIPHVPRKAAIVINSGISRTNSTKERSNQFVRVSVRDILPGRNLFVPEIEIDLRVPKTNICKNRNFRCRHRRLVSAFSDHLDSQIYRCCFGLLGRSNVP